MDNKTTAYSAGWDYAQDENGAMAGVVNLPKHPLMNGEDYAMNAEDYAEFVRGYFDFYEGVYDE